MRHYKKIFFSLILFLFFTTPVKAEVIEGSLMKTADSSSVYWVQPDNTKYVFPTKSVFDSYFKNYDQVKIVDLKELQKYPLLGNVPLKTGSLVKFGFSPKVYQVKGGKELEWIKSEEGLKALGYSLSSVVNLPEIFFIDYNTRNIGQPYDEVLNNINNKFLDKDRAKIADQAATSAKGLVELLGDEYSVFWTSKEYKDFIAWMEDDSFEGIGARIDTKDNVLRVVSPLKGSPAEKAGLKAGDEIKFINDLNTTGFSTEKAVMLIRGPKGQTVILKVKRGGNDNLITIPIVRDVIVVEQFEWSMKKTPSGKDVAYLSLSQFSYGAWQLFVNSSDDILESKPEGIILDLRNNSGGYLGMAIDVASAWLGPDELVVTEERANEKRVKYNSNHHNYFKDIPLAILTNGGSASASEIVAGALQDHEKATLIGAKTFGKGVVQEIIPLSDGNVIKLTVSQWLTPNARQINGTGIVPDIVIESKDDAGNVDEQLDGALKELDGVLER